MFGGGGGGGVSPSHVESSEDPVPPLQAEAGEQRLPRLLCAKVVVLSALCAHLPREA